jgi:hypothetical protein
MRAAAAESAERVRRKEATRAERSSMEEDFRNNLSSQIVTGVRQELLGVVQKALDDGRLQHTTVQHKHANQLGISKIWKTIRI